MTDLPLVSAIMPTAARPDFAARAIEMFLAQDYENSELIILDDGYPQVQPPSNERISYEWVPVRRTIGKKRNLACARAAGEIILHWDDDDRYNSGRISDQVERLIANPDAEMTGYSSMAFENPDGARWAFDGPENYAIGVSLCYWKQAWRERPFLEVNSGEDTAFWRGRKCVSVPARDMIVARIHSGNTSFKNTSENGWRRVA